MKNYLENRDPDSATVSGLVQLCFWLFFFGLGAFLVWISANSPQKPLDLETYLLAAKALAAGEKLYGFTSAVQSVNGELYYYPPLLAYILQPFAHFDLRTVFSGWTALGYLSLLATAWGASLIYGVLKLEPSSSICRLYLFFVLALFFGPVWIGFRWGQVHTVVFALVVFYIYSAMAKREFLAGALLSLAVWIKISPLILILLPLKLKQKRLLLSFIVTSVLVGTLLLIGGIPFSLLWEYVKFFPSLLSGEAFPPGTAESIANFALVNSLSKFAGLSQGSVVLISSKVLISVALLFYIITRPVSSNSQKLAAYGMLICFMLLSSPLVWSHYYTWLLVPLLGLAPSLNLKNAKGKGLCVFVLVTYLFFLKLNYFWSKLWEASDLLLGLFLLLPTAFTFILLGLLGTASSVEQKPLK